jgi:hypothetical protein
MISRNSHPASQYLRVNVMLFRKIGNMVVAPAIEVHKVEKFLSTVSSLTRWTSVATFPAKNSSV